MPMPGDDNNDDNDDDQDDDDDANARCLRGHDGDDHDDDNDDNWDDDDENVIMSTGFNNMPMPGVFAVMMM